MNKYYYFCAMITGVVYGLFCPVANRIVYVGATTRTLKVRLCSHVTALRKRKNNNPLGAYSANKGSEVMQKWMNGLHKKGLVSSIKIIEIEKVEFDDRKELLKREQFHIDCYGYDNLFNIRKTIKQN